MISYTILEDSMISYTILENSMISYTILENSLISYTILENSMIYNSTNYFTTIFYFPRQWQDYFQRIPENSREF